MKLDKVVVKRFDELMAKAKAVEATTMVTDVSATVDSAKYHEWASAAQSLLERVFGEKSAYCRNFQAINSKIIYIAYMEPFENCRGIFKAAKEAYEGGELSELQLLVAAEVFAAFSEQAKQQLKEGCKEAACIVAGVALQTALQHLCARERIHDGKLDIMNADLCKTGIYDVHMQKQITAWGALRNKALQGDWTAYSASDVEEMIKGIDRFIEEHMR